MLKIEELIEEEIYKQDLNKDGLLRYLFKKGLNKAIELNSDFFCENWVDNQFKGNITKANKEEEHWLNECIKADKFIPYEKAIKTFQKELSKEEVLAKAKKDYPIGTKFKSLSKDKILEVIGDYFRWSGKELILDSDSVKNTDSAWIIYNGEWAEIISKPEQTNIMEEKKRKYNFKAVSCKTQEEWDFVISKYNPKDLTKSDFSNYKNIYIIFKLVNSIDTSYLGCYGNSKDKDTQVIQFSEWCKEFNHTPDFIKPIKEWSVGSYVVSINNGHARSKSSESYFIGDIFTISHFYTDSDSTIGIKPFTNVVDKINFKWFPNLQEAEIFSKSLTEKEEDWYFNEKLTEEQFNILISYLKSNGYESFTHVTHEVNYFNYVASGIIRTIKQIEVECSSEKPNHYKAYCIDNNVQNNKIRKTLKDFNILQENNNSVPEYVECINTNTKKIILGKIYKIFDTSTYPEKVSIILDDGEQYNIRDWDESFIKNGNNCFKPSTFKELSAQESLKQWRKLVNIKFTNNCTLNTKECISNSDVIEIGDEVEVVKITKFSTDSGIYLKANIGDRFKVKVAPSNYSESLEIGIKINDGKDYTYPVECFKLIKKASQTTLNTKVDSISPVKVNTNLLNIIKVKGSAPTKVEKKRIRLTILKTKQLNLN